MESREPIVEEEIIAKPKKETIEPYALECCVLNNHEHWDKCKEGDKAYTILANEAWEGN
jgi:hypothetical protein